MLIQINNHLINMMAVDWVEFSDGTNGEAGATVYFQSRATLKLSSSDVSELKNSLARINQAQVRQVAIPFDPRRMN